MVVGFVIENKRGNLANVVFLVSDFTDCMGGTFRAPLEWDPPRLRLDAYQEHPVTLSLVLDTSFFTAGRQYQAGILVRGNDDLELRLVVDVIND